MKVYQAINAVQKELAKIGISKDRNNPTQGFKFRGIDDVYNTVSPLLGEHGLCILPRMLTHRIMESQTKNQTVKYTAVVEAEFDFVSSEDGSKHVVKTFGEAMDMADKATNKAMSAAYKYAVMQAFAIPTEGDNDADGASPPETAPRGNAASPANGSRPASGNGSQGPAPSPNSAAMRDAMIADIRSDKFTQDRDRLGNEIGQYVKQLTVDDQKAVRAEWSKRHDTTVDPAKSEKIADAIVAQLNIADSEKDFDTLRKQVANSERKLTTAHARLLYDEIAKDLVKFKAGTPRGADSPHKPSGTGGHNTPFDADQEVGANQWTQR